MALSIGTNDSSNAPDASSGLRFITHVTIVISLLGFPYSFFLMALTKRPHDGSDNLHSLVLSKMFSSSSADIESGENIAGEGGVDVRKLQCELSFVTIALVEVVVLSSEILHPTCEPSMVLLLRQRLLVAHLILARNRNQSQSL